MIPLLLCPQVVDLSQSQDQLKISHLNFKEVHQRGMEKMKEVFQRVEALRVQYENGVGAGGGGNGGGGNY